MGNVCVSSNDTNYVAARRAPADVIIDVINGVIGDVRSTASQQMMPIAASSNTAYYFDLVYGLRAAKSESLYILGGQLRWALCLSGNPPLCVLMLSVLQLYCCIVENKPSLSHLSPSENP